MPLERSIVASVVRYLKQSGCDVEKMHGSQFGHGGRADLYVLVPVDWANGFPIPVYLEVKQEGKHMTPLQLAWARNKQKYGAVVEEVHSVKEVEEIINALQKVCVKSTTTDSGKN